MYRHERIPLVDPTANNSRTVDKDEVHIALSCVLWKVTRALEEHVLFFLHGHTGIWMNARIQLMEAIACGLFTVPGHGSFGCCRRHVLCLIRLQNLDILPTSETPSQGTPQGHI